MLPVGIIRPGTSYQYLRRDPPRQQVLLIFSDHDAWIIGRCRRKTLLRGPGDELPVRRTVFIGCDHLVGINECPERIAGKLRRVFNIFA